jgi:hypothetical protein
MQLQQIESVPPTPTKTGATTLDKYLRELEMKAHAYFASPDEVTEDLFNRFLIKAAGGVPSMRKTYDRIKTIEEIVTAMAKFTRDNQ